jgi:hypothetical protein
VLDNDAYRWHDGTYAQNCTEYRFPPSGYAPATTDGVYWIQPDTNPPFKAVCDMTTDGGGWTMLAKYISNLELYTYDPSKHQRQTASQGQTLTSAPDLSDNATFGHIAHPLFPVNGRELKFQCRTSPSANWFSHTRSDLFQNWTPGDKGSYGNANGWAAIGVSNIFTRSGHWICGATSYTSSPDFVGIGYCKGPGAGGSFVNHIVSFSFSRSLGSYGGGMGLGCNGNGIDLGKTGQWEGRIWLRDLMP